MEIATSMNIKKILTAILVGTLAGCASYDYGKMSQESGVPKSLLAENCKAISCSYDKLQGRIQATANDMNSFMGRPSSESRTIQYRWFSDSNKIIIDVFLTALYARWSFIESAEVYVGTEMIAKISGKVDRVVGHFNYAVKAHEKVEIISDVINLEAAQKIAEANHETVTIRFYGKNGYIDKELPRKHSLLNVVNLAKSA